jgi:hypothetical protein
MMDGGVTHSSNIYIIVYIIISTRAGGGDRKRRNCKAQDRRYLAVGVLFCLLFSFSFSLFCPFFAFCFFFFFVFCYCKTSGASSPEWVKPTAEGGGICFSVHVYLFCNLQFCFMCVVGFVFCLHSQYG